MLPVLLRIWALATKSAPIVPSKPCACIRALIHSGQMKSAIGRSEVGKNSIGCWSLQRRLFTPATPATVSQVGRSENRKPFRLRNVPQRSFYWAAVGLKWSGGEENLGSAQQVLRSSNADPHASRGRDWVSMASATKPEPNLGSVQPPS
jgi:hypothetical protein